MNIGKIFKILDGRETDARHKAIKMLVREGLSVDKAREFIAYLHKIFPNLKGSLRMFYPGIVRFILNDEIDLDDNKSISQFNTVLKILSNHPAYDFYDKNFNGVSLKSLKESLNLTEDINHKPDKIEYTVVPIPSYNQAKSWLAYAPNWCILQNKETFDDHTIDGVNKFFFLVRSDYKDVKPSAGEDYPYDDYGYSLIAISVDPDGNLASSTSRWNYDDYHDNYLNKTEVENLIGVSLKDLIK